MNTYIATIWQDPSEFVIETRHKLVQGDVVGFESQDGRGWPSPFRVLEVDNEKNRILLKRLHHNVKRCTVQGVYDPLDGGPLLHGE